MWSTILQSATLAVSFIFIVSSICLYLVLVKDGTGYAIRTIGEMVIGSLVAVIILSAVSIVVRYLYMRGV